MNSVPGCQECRYVVVRSKLTIGEEPGEGEEVDGNSGIQEVHVDSPASLAWPELICGVVLYLCRNVSYNQLVA